MMGFFGHNCTFCYIVNKVDDWMRNTFGEASISFSLINKIVCSPHCQSCKCCALKKDRRKIKKCKYGGTNIITITRSYGAPDLFCLVWFRYVLLSFYILKDKIIIIEF